MAEEPTRDQPAEPESPAGSAAVPTCYRHPERETYIRCQRCDRNICPDCQRQAAVGFQCPECVKQGSQGVPAARTRFGGVIRGEGAIVTKVLVGINVAVFLLGLLAPALIQRLELIGRSGFAETIGMTGGVEGGEVWRLLTAAFTHTQPLHIMINMFSLWVLGPPLEAVLGRLRFTALYLVSALVGSTAAYVLAPQIHVVGASGAIFGLFGATFMFARRMRADMSWFVGLIAVNVVINILFHSQLSWQGHLGGLVAGLVLGAFLAYAPRERRDQVQLFGFGLVMVLTIVAVVVRTITLP
ncbi:rhomboid family intramembrane serine protease [Flindersiella endophytica]